MIKINRKRIAAFMGILGLTTSSIFSAGTVSVLGTWVKGAQHVKEAGVQRALVVMLYAEGSGNISAASVTYGGKPMTKVVEKAYSNGTYSYTGAFILNEIGLASSTTNAIAVSWSMAPTTGFEIVSAFLGNTNQAGLIGAAMSGFSVGPTVTTDAPGNASGDMILLAGTAANNGTYTLNNGFIRGMPETSASFGDITAAYKSGTGALEIPSLTHSIGLRQTMVAFNVKAASTPANQAPIISITSPAQGASFTAPANVTVNASASDPDGSIIKVELRNNGVVVGVDTLAPYSFNLNGLSSGSYALEARAYDNQNATKNASISISVNPSSGEKIPWLESFTLSNGRTSDLAPTSWTAVRATGTFSTNGNRLAINGAGTEGVFTSGLIDISMGNVEVSIDLVSQGNLESNQDYVKLYKKVNGGAEVLIGEKWGNQVATKITAPDIAGNTLQLVLRTYVTAPDEFYFIDNINVSKKSANAWVNLGNPISKIAASLTDMIAVNGIKYVGVADPEYGNRLTVYMNYGTSWVPLGARGITDAAIVDVKLGQENGQIYVLYIESGAMGGLTYVRTFDGTTWSVVGYSALTTKGLTADDIEIKDEVVYASFSEYIEPDTDPCRYGNPICISKLNGTAWDRIRTDCSGKYGSPFQISLSNGAIYSEFHTNYSPWFNFILLEVYDGFSWIEVTRRDILESVQEGMQVILDGLNIYTAYSIGSENAINCEMFNGTAWNYVGPQNFLNVSDHNFALAASNGKPYIAYENLAKVSVVAYNGSTWNLVGAPDFSTGPWSEMYGSGNDGKLMVNGNTPVILLSTKSSAQIKVMEYSSNTPDWKPAGAPLLKTASSLSKMLVVDNITYIAVADPLFGDRLTVFKQNGSEWLPVGNRGFSNSSVANNSFELGFDNGELYVAYLDGTSSMKSGFVKKFVGSAWQSVGSTAFTNIGASLSDFEVKGGSIYVSFLDYTVPEDELCRYGNFTIISKLNGTAWVRISEGCTGKFGSAFQLSSSNGILYAESREQYFPYSMTTNLTAYNGTAWSQVTNKAITPGRDGMGVYLEGNNMYLTYISETSNAMICEKFNGTSWGSLPLPNYVQDPLSGFELSLVDGNPYIAFGKEGSTSVIAYKNSNWGYVGNPGFLKSSMSFGKNLNGSSPYLLLAPSSGQIVNAIKFE